MNGLGLLRMAHSSEENATVLALRTVNKQQQEDSKPVVELQDDNEKQDPSNTMQKRHPLLRYAYRDDQWSPLNKNGNRIYDREFLIELLNDPKSNIKPLNLPDVSIILDISRNLRSMDVIQLKEVDRLASLAKFGILDYYLPETVNENQSSENTIDIKSVKDNENKEPDHIDISPKRSSLLKHTYAPDQWSPLNKNGKKVYDGEFLKKLESNPISKMRPLNLPDLEVVLKDKSSPSAQKKKKRKDKKLAVSDESVCIKEDIKLRETKNAWKPSRLRTSNAGEENNTTETLYKKVRIALNKLMPKKLDILANEMKMLKIDSREKLQGVVNMVYEKAVTEPQFMAVYALMCKELAPIQASNCESEADNEDNNVNFRNLILTRCVMELEKAFDENTRAIQKGEIADTDLGNESGQTLAKQETITRIKSFGNIRFMGELFNQEMVTTYTLHRCIQHLLTQIDDDSLECLSKLLITVGKDFEQKNQKLDSYFEQMMDIIDGKVPGKISSRVRFILHDTIELRKNNWIPRTDHSSTKMMDKIGVEPETIPTTSNFSKPALIMSEEEVAKKCASILEKYLYNANVGNAALAVRETFDNSTFANFVREILNRVVDKSATARKQVSQLMTHLISKNILPLSLYLAGLADVLEMAEDLVIDIPKIWVYLAELIWYPLVKGVHPMSELQTVIAPVKSMHRVEELISSIKMISLQEKKELKWDDYSRENQCFDDSMKKHPSVDDLQSSNENVPQNITAVAQKIVKPKTSSALKNISSKPDKQVQSTSTLPISEPASSVSRDHADTNDESSRASTPQFKKPGSLMTKKNLAKKSATILENYLSNASIETAAAQVRETFDNSTFPNFVRESLSRVVNKSETDRKQVSQLMAHLISENILPLSLYLSSLREVLDGTGNVVIDFAKIWIYLAELIWYPLAKGVHPFSELKNMMAPLKNKGLAGALMGELMVVLVQEKSPEWIKDEWNQSGLELNDFLQENESPNDFVTKYKLEFLFKDSSSSFASSSGQLTMAEIHDHLLGLMSDKNENCFNNICSWISTNVGQRASDPEFIKVLMTTILEVSIEPYNNTWQFKVDKFQNVQDLIPRYIDANIKLTEIQCLIAIQEYIHQLEHPQSVLLELLEKQIFESILSFDVYHVWKSNEDPKPLSGKSAAMMALKSFFTSLKKQELQI